LKGSLTNNEKGRVHPIAGHDGTKREYRFTSTLSFIRSTSALDWGRCSTPGTGLFNAWKYNLYSLKKRLI